MHLLYLDYSGDSADPRQEWVVLAGVSVFERRAHWIEQRLNEIAGRFDPDDPHNVEFHGSPMRSGACGWRDYPYDDRLQAMREALRDGIGTQRRGVKVFSAAVKEGANLHGKDVIEYVFEQVASRFDHYLARLYGKYNDPQRGIILFDKSITEQRIQTLARNFKQEGHTWGKTRNYAEVPVFLDSKASRLIQLADLVAYAVYRKHAQGDCSLVEEIEDCFDSDGGVVHGYHVKE